MEQEKRIFKDNTTFRMIAAHPFSLQEHNCSLKSPSNEWWTSLCTNEEMQNMHSSAKMTILFEILNQCIFKSEKLLVFSQSKATLNTIEQFLKLLQPDVKYFRIDGEIKAKDRKVLCDKFNSDINLK